MKGCHCLCLRHGCRKKIERIDGVFDSESICNGCGVEMAKIYIEINTWIMCRKIHSSTSFFCAVCYMDKGLSEAIFKIDKMNEINKGDSLEVTSFDQDSRCWHTDVHVIFGEEMVHGYGG
jgi:hypothetical protein